MVSGAPPPNPMMPANADAGMYSPNRFPPQQPRSVHIYCIALPVFSGLKLLSD